MILPTLQPVYLLQQEETAAQTQLGSAVTLWVHEVLKNEGYIGTTRDLSADVKLLSLRVPKASFPPLLVPWALTLEVW